MANSAVLTSSLFVLTFCIGYGDGRWKRKERESLFHDIDVFKRMAEKIEHEIEAFYEDYPGEQIKGDDIEKIQQKYIKNVLDHKTGSKNLLDGTETTSKFGFSANITNEIPENLKSKDASQSRPTYVTFRNNNLSTSSPNWPKFEDILLEMGKRYDWKNDRWIKVKRKQIDAPKKTAEDNSVSFYEKHKFSYRSVKLNRKSRRNIVIAVTAVR